MRFATGLATIAAMFFAVVFALCVLCGAAHAQNRERYAHFFPPTEDSELAALLADPSFFWYTAREMPPVFQHDFGSPFVSVYRDIGPGGPRYSNGNGEWPWANPATDREDGRAKGIIGIRHTGVQTFRTQFLQYEIVRTLRGGRWVGYIEQQGNKPGLGWRFGPGTEILEINLNRIANGDYCFKVHRMTMTPGNEWFFRVYRPFVSQAEYESATNTKAVPIGPVRKTTPHDFKPFDEVRDLVEVPRIEPQLARQLLLKTPFKLATSDEFIPTTRFTDQIYPQGYLGAYIGNAANQENCRKCHVDVAVNVRKFASGEWYGQIRGGGHDKHGVGVFSWYPR